MSDTENKTKTPIIDDITDNITSENVSEGLTNVSQIQNIRVVNGGAENVSQKASSSVISNQIMESSGMKSIINKISKGNLY